MTRYGCPGCGYVYDERAGDAREGFAPGTPWSGVPEDWPAPTAPCVRRPTSRPRMAEHPAGGRSPSGCWTRPPPITVEHGWAAVTMAKVAGIAGVSRQTVYNEYGAKAALGQAMVLRELDRFLDRRRARAGHPRRPGGGDPSAAEQTLRLAQATRC